MDYQQLIFAAEVRKLAVETWTKERDIFRKRASGVTPDQMTEWDKQNAFITYIPTALNQILQVAVHIQETEEMSKPGSGATPS
jgi:hypothetical protein